MQTILGALLTSLLLINIAYIISIIVIIDNNIIEYFFNLLLQLWQLLGSSYSCKLKGAG